MAKRRRTEGDMEVTTTKDHIIIKYKGITAIAPRDPGEEVRRACAKLLFEGRRKRRER